MTSLFLCPQTFTVNWKYKRQGRMLAKKVMVDDIPALSTP